MSILFKSAQDCIGVYSDGNPHRRKLVLEKEINIHHNHSVIVYIVARVACISYHEICILYSCAGAQDFTFYFVSR